MIKMEYYATFQIHVFAIWIIHVFEILLKCIRTKSKSVNYLIPYMDLFNKIIGAQVQGDWLVLHYNKSINVHCKRLKSLKI
jgi:hypothetical protein